MSEEKENTVSQNTMADAEPKKTRKLGCSTILVLFLLAIAALFGSMPWWQFFAPDMVRAYLPPMPTATDTASQYSGDDSAAANKLRERVNLLEEDTRELENKLVNLANSFNDMRDMPVENLATATPDQQMDTLTQALAPANEDYKKLVVRVEELRSKIQDYESIKNAANLNAQQVAMLTKTVEANAMADIELATQIAELTKSSADAATVLQLVNRLETLDSEVKTLIARGKEPIVMLLATAQLREAVLAGRPFDQEYRTLSAISQHDHVVLDELKPLSPARESGVSTVTELVVGYPQLAGKAYTLMYRVEEKNLLDRIKNWLLGFVSLYPTDVKVTLGDGSQNEADSDTQDKIRLASADTYLKERDLSAALEEISTLQNDKAKAVFADWMKQAKMRLTAEQNISEMTAHIMATMKANRMKGE